MGGKISEKRRQGKRKQRTQSGCAVSIQIAFLLGLDLLAPTPVAHSDIAVIAPQKHLTACGENGPAGIQTGIDGGLGAAGAHGLDLCNGIGQLHQTAGARKKMGKKICAQTKTEDRKIRFVYNLTQLVNLLGGEELCLVRDDNVIVFSRLIAVI